MKVVLQSLRSGTTEVVDSARPCVRRGALLIANEASVISAGTERMLVEFGRANMLQKARSQPDKVRQVLDKMRTDGLFTTLEAVKSKLDDPIPLGYSACGRVIAVGEGVEEYSVGDRVASNGNHAGVVCVPKHLCARVPEGLKPEAAAFTTVGAIALQGLRLARPCLGEVVVVTGLGLIGLIAVQLLRASGCEVIGLDPSTERLEVARRFGAHPVAVSKDGDVVTEVRALTSGRGVDAVIVAASTTSNEPVAQAARMCRLRGRIVLIGVAGLELNRSDFYEKELSFQVSCSYGPGRYDPRYEDEGQDYPIGYVRWTAQRNFEAVLGALAEGRINVDPLISGRYPIAMAADAYARLTNHDDSVLGLVLQYPPETGLPAGVDSDRTVRIGMPSTSSSGPPIVGFIGAGNYASRVLIPAFAATDARLKWVATSSGVSATKVARRYQIELSTSDVANLINDPEVNAIVIATRHDSHASLTCRALQAGKHVFVEKPLGLTDVELDEVEATLAQLDASGDTPHLMVGFNRRFAPLVVQLKRTLDGKREPKALIMTVNAGTIPGDHWTQSRSVGGGRLVGEACHFVDLARHLVGSPIIDVTTVSAQRGDKVGDVASISLRFSDGSIATVHYFASGHRSFPKERIEVFVGGVIHQLDNFRVLRTWGGTGRTFRSLRQNKGQTECATDFVAGVKQGRPTVSALELLETSRWAIRAATTNKG